MKSILFVLDSYETGGVLTVTKMYSDLLLDEGYKVIVIGKEGDASMETVFPKCIQYKIPGMINDSFSGRFKDWVSYSHYLSRVYRENTINIIHFSQTWSSLYALFKFNTWHFKRISTFHGAYDLENRDYFEVSLLKNFINIFRKLAQGYILSQSKKIVVLSNYSEQLLINHFSYKLKDRIHVIPGFVNDQNCVNIQ